MPDPTLFILAGCGLALGAIVSQLRGPTCWSWQGRAGDLHRRLSCLPRGAPPVVRRAAGMTVLAALLAGGALTAYAAQPSAAERQATGAAVDEDAAAPGPTTGPMRLAAAAIAAAPSARAPAQTGPDALPAQVRGVVGSGDQLALQLQPAGDAPARTLQIGDTFEGGWVLSGLDASAATLTKAGVSRTVGLNPGGVMPVASPATGETTVTVISAVQARVDAAQQAVADARQAVLKTRAMVVTPDTPWQTLQQVVLAANRALVAAQREETHATMIMNGADQAELDAYDAMGDRMQAAIDAQNAALQAQRAGQ